jgi:hypothetical protein
MAGANWPRYIAANVCYPAGKSASRTAGVGREPSYWLRSSGRWARCWPSGPDLIGKPDRKALGALSYGMVAGERIVEPLWVELR